MNYSGSGVRGAPRRRAAAARPDGARRAAPPDDLARGDRHLTTRAAKAEDIRRDVERARVHYRQEAIYVSYLGTAEILGPSA